MYPALSFNECFYGPQFNLKGWIKKLCQNQIFILWTGRKIYLFMEKFKRNEHPASQSLPLFFLSILNWLSWIPLKLFLLQAKKQFNWKNNQKKKNMLSYLWCYWLMICKLDCVSWLNHVQLMNLARQIFHVAITGLSNIMIYIIYISLVSDTLWLRCSIHHYARFWIRS